MENASKALLIAGSILIAIVLIAVGVKIFNSTQGTTDAVETNLSNAEKDTFNSKFLQYEGTAKSATEVRSLVNLIISNNATNPLSVGIEYVDEGDNGGKWTIEQMKSFINVIDSSKTYTITLYMGDGDSHRMPIKYGKEMGGKITPKGLIYRAIIDME